MSKKKDKEDNTVLTELKDFIKKNKKLITMESLIDIYMEATRNGKSTLTKLTPQRRSCVEIFKNKAGNVSETCEAVGISRYTFYNWLKIDEDFAVAIFEVEEGQKDFAESQLMKLISNQHYEATKFYLSTKGKDRGYVATQHIVQEGIIGIYKALDAVPIEAVRYAANYIPLYERIENKRLQGQRKSDNSE